MLQEFFSAAHHAADVGAHLHVELAARSGGQHGVIADYVAHFESRQVEANSDFHPDSVRQKSNLVLGVKKRRHQGTALGRIVRHHLRKALFEFFRKSHTIWELRKLVVGKRKSLPVPSVSHFQKLHNPAIPTGQFLPARYQSIQSRPPHRLANALRTSLAASADWPGTPPAYARGMVSPFRR